MKNLVISVSMLVLGSVQAKADGFICQSRDESLNIKVFNHTDPNEGTRAAAVMIVSDPSINIGRKTIAKFIADETLTSASSIYVGKVDQRFTDLRRDGELIGGTKLGELKSIALTVGFSYDAPVADGEHVRGVIKLTKRNGEIIRMPADCTRYLKGE